MVEDAAGSAAKANTAAAVVVVVVVAVAGGAVGNAAGGCGRADTSVGGLSSSCKSMGLEIRQHAFTEVFTMQ